MSYILCIILISVGSFVVQAWAGHMYRVGIILPVSFIAAFIVYSVSVLFYPVDFWQVLGAILVVFVAGLVGFAASAGLRLLVREDVN